MWHLFRVKPIQNSQWKRLQAMTLMTHLQKPQIWLKRWVIFINQLEIRHSIFSRSAKCAKWNIPKKDTVSKITCISNFWGIRKRKSLLRGSHLKPRISRYLEISSNCSSYLFFFSTPGINNESHNKTFYTANKISIKIVLIFEFLTDKCHYRIEFKVIQAIWTF